MSAVANPTRATPASRGACEASATTSSAQLTTAAIKAAFGQVEVLLNEAFSAEEDHGQNCDSVRLLGIAHDLADKAEIHPPVGAKVQRVALDIAALIRAARPVPGDKESLQRQVMLDQVAVHLSWILGTEVRVSGLCAPSAPRPAAPGSTTAGIDAKIAHEVDCIELARQATYEIQKLAETMQGVAERFGNEEHPITHGIMARIIALSEITFHAAALHGEGRAESIPLEELQHAFKGGI